MFKAVGRLINKATGGAVAGGVAVRDAPPADATLAPSRPGRVALAGRAATTKSVGDAGEDRALAHLLRQGLTLECRNYRLAGGPNMRGAEIDLILRDPHGTLIFCEVRARADARHGGAAATISAVKRQRIARAAAHYLMRYASPPACRFDVVAITGDELLWLRGAFEL